ncbi:MAG TPA: DUF3783 domain-containing protein [bacterium]|nr:DUF3783 domain-containing protein [bacterium]
MTDATFRQLDNGEQRGPGPRIILIGGFQADEVMLLKEFVDRTFPERIRLRLCTAQMLDKTLGDALSQPVDDNPAPPDKLPRFLLLSGMSNREIHALINRFGSTGLPRPLFAATTSANLHFLLRQLLLELLQEHKAMMARRQAQGALNPDER